MAGEELLLVERIVDFLAEASTPLPVTEILGGLGLPKGAPSRAEINAILYQDRTTFAHLGWASPPHWYVVGCHSPAEEMAQACALIARRRKGEGKEAVALTVGEAVERFEAGGEDERR